MREARKAQIEKSLENEEAQLSIMDYLETKSADVPKPSEATDASIAKKFVGCFRVNILETGDVPETLMNRETSEFRSLKIESELKQNRFKLKDLPVVLLVWKDVEYKGQPVSSTNFDPNIRSHWSVVRSREAATKLLETMPDKGRDGDGWFKWKSPDGVAGKCALLVVMGGTSFRNVVREWAKDATKNKHLVGFLVWPYANVYHALNDDEITLVGNRDNERHDVSTKLTHYDKATAFRKRLNAGYQAYLKSNKDDGDKMNFRIPRSPTRPSHSCSRRLA